MRLVEIAHGAAVAHHQILESPLVAQNLLKQPLRTAAGVVVKALVGTHHFPDLGILHQRLEGWHVGLPKVAHGHVGQVGRVARVFRSAVHGVVLGAGPKLTILRRLRSLQATHHLRTHHAGQEGVLAVGFLATSPARVAEDVHVWRPHAQAAHLHVLALQVVHAVVVLRTEFRRGHVEHLIEQVRIERGSHGDGLGEHRHVAHVGSAVQRLAPPEKLLDAQTRNGRALVEHQLSLFFQRQARAEVHGALLGAQVRVLVGQRLCCHASGHRQGGSQQKNSCFHCFEILVVVVFAKLRSFSRFGFYFSIKFFSVSIFFVVVSSLRIFFRTFALHSTKNPSIIV